MKIVNGCFLTVLFALLVAAADAGAQDMASADRDSISEAEIPADTVAAKTTLIYLMHADTVSYDKEVMKADAQFLEGNVVFRHDSSYMYCDSAYFFEASNSLEAFSSVRMEQGDTLFVYGNYLFYDGNTQIARLRENVRMENGQVTLFTDSLNYERVPDIGYYFEGGLLVDSLNQLSSFYGQYSPGTKEAVFNDSVRLENQNFTLYSDTLHYNTATKIATILGPSVIVSDSGTIYSSHGWYDTEANVALLLDQSEVLSGDRLLTGDSIAYDRNSGIGEVFGNMCLRDTVRKVTLEGQHGFYNERTEYAFATDSARMLEYSKGDTLYLHADTLEMTALDSVSREIKAFYGVRFFRTDMQGVCDNMRYNTRDSVLYMYDGPVLWNEQYQISGDTIVVYMNDSTIDYAHVIQSAFAVQHIESSYFNQLKGNDLKAYFEGKVVRQIDIEGNAESIFYPLDNGAMIGMNTTRSGFLTIWVKDNKLDRLKIWPNPQGTLTPMPDLKPDQKTLKDFHWYDKLRPKDKDDIYRVVPKSVEVVPVRNNKFRHE